MNGNDPLHVLIEFGASPNFVWKLGEGRKLQESPYHLPEIAAVKTIGDLLKEIEQFSVPHLMGFGAASRENFWRALVRYMDHERR